MSFENCKQIVQEMPKKGDVIMVKEPGHSDYTPRVCTGRLVNGKPEIYDSIYSNLPDWKPFNPEELE